MKRRVELPVLLYVDVAIDIRNDAEGARDLAMADVWQWLGKPGEEEGVVVATPASSLLSNARIYPSDLAWCNSAKHFEFVDEYLAGNVGGERQ